jgi:hypothetical protein
LTKSNELRNIVPSDCWLRGQPSFAEATEDKVAELVYAAGVETQLNNAFEASCDVVTALRCASLHQGGPQNKSSGHAFDGRVAELVDALDSKSSGSNTVRVQVPLRPPNA